MYNPKQFLKLSKALLRDDNPVNSYTKDIFFSKSLKSLDYYEGGVFWLAKRFYLTQQLGLNNNFNENINMVHLKASPAINNPTNYNNDLNFSFFFYLFNNILDTHYLNYNNVDHYNPGFKNKHRNTVHG